MKKVFHFDAPREKYHCDAAILSCFDNRFELGFRKFLKRIALSIQIPSRSQGAQSVWRPPNMRQTASLSSTRFVNRFVCMVRSA